MAGAYPVLQLDAGQFSHPGRRRPNNEDWLGTFQPEDPERLAAKGSLFLVADGMGGHESGELASRRAVDLVIRAYMDDPGSDVPTSLRKAIEMANAALYAGAADRQGARHWGTTLVAAVVRHDELWIANVGDSRAYLIRDGKLRQLSQDHSWASAAGEAPSKDWIGRHLITRALGSKPEVQVDVFPPVQLQARDSILLCSDGLTTPLSDEEICDVAVHTPHSSQQGAEALVQAANDRGGPDNISVILVRVAGRSMSAGWQTAGGGLAALVRPETWKLVVESLLQAVLGEEQGFRSPVFIVVVLLLVLAVIALGFILGLVIFR
jgi:serine/threonine protein phosphatase PrpC